MIFFELTANLRNETQTAAINNALSEVCVRKTENTGNKKPYRTVRFFCERARIRMSIIATGSGTVPIKIGMLYPAEVLINSLILVLLFQDFISSSLLLAAFLS